MPRPLVFERVGVHVRGYVCLQHGSPSFLFTIFAFSGDYKSAFLACRKHRVDLTFLVTLDPIKFEHSLQSFVERVDDVEYINLFLSTIGYGH